MAPAQPVSTRAGGAGATCQLCAAGAIAMAAGMVLPPVPSCGTVRGAPAVTPRASQVQVKKHVQLILERLLHTVNRRLIVLERENALRVSVTVTVTTVRYAEPGAGLELQWAGGCSRCVEAMWAADGGVWAVFSWKQGTGPGEPSQIYMPRAGGGIVPGPPSPGGSRSERGSAAAPGRATAPVRGSCRAGGKGAVGTPRWTWQSWCAEEWPHRVP